MATDEVNTAILTDFSSTTNVILATDEVITQLKKLSRQFKRYLGERRCDHSHVRSYLSHYKGDLGHLQTGVSQFKGYPSHYKVILATEELITATFKNS